MDRVCLSRASSAGPMPRTSCGAGVPGTIRARITHPKQVLAGALCKFPRDSPFIVERKPHTRPPKVVCYVSSMVFTVGSGCFAIYNTLLGHSHLVVSKTYQRRYFGRAMAWANQPPSIQLQLHFDIRTLHRKSQQDVH